MKAELVPDNGDPPIPITRDLTVVGRRDYCDIVIDDASLSKRHCVLVKTDGLLVIRDLGTTNGTKVKGQRIRWAALLPDDRISLGSYKVRIYLGPDDTLSPSEQYRSKWKGSNKATDRDQDRVPVGEQNPNAPAVPGVLSAGASFPEPSLEDIDSSQFFDESELEPPSHLPRLPKFDDDSRIQFEIIDEDEDEDIFDLD